MSMDNIYEVSEMNFSFLITNQFPSDTQYTVVNISIPVCGSNQPAIAIKYQGYTLGIYNTAAQKGYLYQDTIDRLIKTFDLGDKDDEET